MAQSIHRCAQCGVNVVKAKRGPEFRCPCCDATTVVLSGKPIRKGQRGDLVRRRNLDLSRFTIEKRETDLFVSWKWNRLKGILGLAILALVIGLFTSGRPRLLFDLVVDIVRFDFSFLAGQGTISAVFHVLWLISMVGLLYWSCCHFVNRTEIAFRETELRVWHGPLLCRWQTRVSVHELDGFKVHKKVSQSDGNQKVSFELHAVRNDGQILKLVKHESQSSLPRAVASLLTAHLETLQPKTEPEVNVDMSVRDDVAETPRITLTCPNCAGTLDPPPERAELCCRHCGADVPIPREVQTQLGLDPARRHSQERLQATFTVREDGGSIFFSADWDRSVPRLLFPFAAGLVAIGLTGIGLTWFCEGGLVPYGLSLIPIGLGLTLGYIAVCYVFNRTEVVFDSNALHIWNGPLFWRNPRPLPPSDLTQFVVRKNSYWSTSDKTDIRWDLFAISHYGANQIVFSEVKDREALETVEYLVEKRIKIVDQAVRD